MSHLSIRTTSEDEHRLSQLCEIFGLDRSDATREALKIALSYVHQSTTHDRLSILSNSAFVGGGLSKSSPKLRYKQKLRHKLRKKHGKTE